MDLGLTEEQEMIRTSARTFLEKECPKLHVREMEEDKRGYSPQLWKQMAELGWMGLAVPERYGGTGNTFIDLGVLIEEHGRHLVPGPFFSTTALGATAILDAGTEAQKSEHLPLIARGDRIIAYAQTEPSGRWDAAGIEMTAAASGEHYILNGVKSFVPYGHVADYLLAVARTSGKGETGITVLLVDAKSPGIKAIPFKSLASDHQCEITFKDVKAPKASVLGQAGKGWSLVQRIMAWGAAGKCVEMVGYAQRELEMAVEYSKRRMQFGKPIGTFQAVQHHCANMAIDVDGSRFIAYEAVWRLSEGLEASKEVATAKAWVSDAARRVSATAHQVHGAIGSTMDHDMQLFSRRCKGAELMFGIADEHRERVAVALLD